MIPWNKGLNKNDPRVAKYVNSRLRGEFRDCLTCYTKFWVQNNLLKIGKGKYCSKPCLNKGQVGTEARWVKRGNSALLNTGRTRFKTGQVFSSESEKKRIANIPKGEGHTNWKGDMVGYTALHDWVRSQLGMPRQCEECGENKRKMYHWANRSGEYKRDISDWIRLCVPCHKALDLNRISHYKEIFQDDRRRYV